MTAGALLLNLNLAKEKLRKEQSIFVRLKNLSDNTMKEKNNVRLKIVLTANIYGYRRNDGAFGIPLGCLKT